MDAVLKSIQEAQMKLDGLKKHTHKLRWVNLGEAGKDGTMIKMQCIKFSKD